MGWGYGGLLVAEQSRDTNANLQGISDKITAYHLDLTLGTDQF